ncbi:cytochrome C, partial [bacterium]
MEQQRAENRLILAYLYVALVSVFIGTFFGLLQVTSRAGLFQTPSWFDYYRMLTAHGVLLALVFTTLFISGLST